MENKNNKNNSQVWIMAVVLVFAVIFIVYFAGTGNAGTRISSTQLTNMIEENQITDIFLSGNVGYARKVDSTIKDSDFPKNADYNFDISYSAQVNVIYDYNEKVRLANAGTAEEKAQYANYAGREVINIITKAPSEPFLNAALPYISILAIGFIGFLMFRMFSGKGNAAGGFGRSRAKVSEKSTIKFADIAGADEEKAETAEIVEFLKNPAKFKALGARIPKGVLLVGAPGTGKTLLAKAVAGESSVPFFSITGSDFVELYVGVGASRVRDLFDTAKRNAPCILFIDEIDAVGRQRGAGLGGGNDEREQTLNQLLVEMDGFESYEGIIVLAATNRADVLDPALLRPGRFDRQIFVNVPDVKGREGIIRIHAKNKPIDEDIDIKAIARLTSGFTGADIENFLNEAAILAARDNRLTITMQDITEGINKVMMGPQKKSRIVTDKDKKLTAYHEAGHAIITHLLNYGEKVHEVSIIPRGMAGGYTSTRPDTEDDFFSLEKLTKRLCMTMGGRAAEEIVFNDITAGARGDIASATRLARKMITEWGMSKEIGLVNFGTSTEVFIGRDYQMQTNYSEATAALIDKEMKNIIDASYKKAVDLLKKNRKILDNMAELLLEKETIYNEEVEMIMNGMPYKKVAEQLEAKEQVKKQQHEKKKAQQQAEQNKKMQELKVQAAEALNNAGVISKQELDMIKAESAVAQAKYEEVAKTSAVKEEVKQEPSAKKPAPKKAAAKTTTKQVSKPAANKATAAKKPAAKKATQKKTPKSDKEGK